MDKVNPMTAKTKRKKVIALVALLVLIGAALYGFVDTKKPTDPSPLACGTLTLTGAFDSAGKIGFYEGKLVRPGKELAAVPPRDVLAAYYSPERWIEVDLSEQMLRAWDGDQLYLQSPVSTGLPWWPTPTGEFRIWIKLRYTNMEGGEGRYYYNLPNVPYVMFFSNADVPAYKGYGLHGTYWHNDFGTVHSHGCVNLPTDVAGQLYNWVSPTISGTRSVQYADADNPGTRIVIHE